MKTGPFEATGFRQEEISPCAVQKLSFPFRDAEKEKD